MIAAAPQVGCPEAGDRVSRDPSQPGRGPLTLQLLLAGSLAEREGHVHNVEGLQLSLWGQLEGLHHDGRPAEVLVQGEQQEGGLQQDGYALQ